MIVVDDMKKIKQTDKEILQKLKNKRDEANLAVKRKEDEIKEKERVLRERHFREIGKLLEGSFELYKLHEYDLNFFAGMFDESARIVQENPDKAGEWKESGKIFLASSQMNVKKKETLKEESEEII